MLDTSRSMVSLSLICFFVFQKKSMV